MILSLNSILCVITPPKTTPPKEHHERIVNTFITNPELIVCRESLRPHYCLESELILRPPQPIEDIPCDYKEVRCILSFINCRYWNGDMPHEVTRAVMQIYRIVPNRNLFTLLISNVIQQTSGLKHLDSSFYNETGEFRSRGIIQLKGKEYYELASKPVTTNFVKCPDSLATLRPDAVKGSVYVWLSIAMKNGGVNLYFEESVKMMKVWESENGNMHTEEGKQRWESRRFIYERVCRCFNIRPRYCVIPSPCNSVSSKHCNGSFNIHEQPQFPWAPSHEEEDDYSWCGGDHSVCRELGCCRISGNTVH